MESIIRPNFALECSDRLFKNTLLPVHAPHHPPSNANAVVINTIITITVTITTS